MRPDIMAVYDRIKGKGVPENLKKGWKEKNRVG